LRIGYVSAYFHRPNWMKPVWAVVNRHDRSRFQVHLFADAPAEAELVGYRQQPGDHVHNTSGMTNEAVADLISRQGVSVLIDLNGFSVPRRLALFALRAAPKQAGWFNLYGTSGLPGLDYLLGDDHVIPAAEEPSYSERILRVPGSYLAFEVDHPVPDLVPPPMLKTGRLTIGCLASQYKITDQVIETWAEILRRCPEAKLLLRNATLGRPEHREHLLARFAGKGVVSERLELEGPGQHLDFLRTYDRVDFALDVFPYSGGTTTTEALWQGVPVVTFDGGRWASRTSLSLLRAAGLDEFVGRDRREYAEIAVRLATSPQTPELLRGLRGDIRARLRASPVCDAEGLTRSLEGLYQKMWDERGR
jgi:predicted O-linked N-acetylglucosamine transferase (SPINDLY family)